MGRLWPEEGVIGSWIDTRSGTTFTGENNILVLPRNSLWSTNLKSSLQISFFHPEGVLQTSSHDLFLGCITEVHPVDTIWGRLTASDGNTAREGHCQHT